jgi:hypothetical protein
VRVPLLAAVIVIGVLAVAANAAAATRYASPTGSGAACTNLATPCAIDVAVNSAVVDDEVVLLGGVPPAAPFVTSTALLGVSGVDIHGAPGARPVIQSSAVGDAVTVQGGLANLADVIVEYTGSAAAVRANGGTVSRVSAHGAGASTSACTGNSSAFFTDSVCWETGLGATAAFLAGTGTTTSVNLRNVTAISAGGGPGLESRSTTMSSIGVVAVNTVALSGGAWDVTARKTSTGGSTVGMLFSNFATTDADTGASVTAAGSGSNLTTPPVFVDRANGDFRQFANSTGTVDKGTASVGLGSFDFEGQARTQGAAPDIGADEGAIPLPPPFTCCTSPSPTTSFDLKAALKKCKKIKSKVKRQKCIKRAKAKARA